MDIALYYEEKGSGEPLILLHGNGEEHGYFKHQIDYFSEKYRVIALDTCGHGRSPRGTAPFTIEQFALDLHDFMDDHNIGRAHLLGFSDGGNIALNFAMKYPERLRSLILNGANLYPKGVKASVQIPIEMGYGLARLMALKSEKARYKAELLGLMVNEPYIKPERLKKVKTRTLVLAGTRDMIKESHTKLMARMLPNCRLALIEGDHFIADKNPEIFNRVVENFLANL